MIFLYIFLALLALIFFILMLRISITVFYSKELDSNGEYAVLAGVGPIKIKLVPKNKKPKLKDFSAKKYRKLMAADNSKKRTKKPVRKKVGKVEKKESLLPDSLSDTLDLVLDLLRKFTGFLRCEVLRIRLNIGTKDAASTALAYASATSDITFFLEAIRCNAELRLKSPEDVCIDADFDNHEIHGDIGIRFSIRVINMLRAGGSFIIYFFKKLIRIDKTQNKSNKSRNTAERSQS